MLHFLNKIESSIACNVTNRIPSVQNCWLWHPQPSCPNPLSDILPLHLCTMRMGDHPVLIGIPNKTLKGLVYSNVQNLKFWCVATTNEVHSSATILNWGSSPSNAPGPRPSGGSLVENHGWLSMVSRLPESKAQTPTHRPTPLPDNNKPSEGDKQTHCF